MNRRVVVRISVQVALTFGLGFGACIDGGGSSVVGNTEQADSAGDLGTALGAAVASGSTLGMSNDDLPSCFAPG